MEEIEPRTANQMANLSCKKTIFVINSSHNLVPGMYTVNVLSTIAHFDEFRVEIKPKNEEVFLKPKVHSIDSAMGMKKPEKFPLNI